LTFVPRTEILVPYAYAGGSSRYGWTIAALYSSVIGKPTCSAESGVIQHSGVEVYESLAYAIMVAIQVGLAQKVC